MKLKYVTILCFLVFVVGLGLGVARKWQTEQEAIKEGSKPYTPTRLEWLCLNLNMSEISATANIDTTKDRAWIRYTANRETDTLIVNCYHYHDAYAYEIDGMLLRGRLSAQRTIKHHEWENWLKIEEKRVQVQYPEQLLKDVERRK